MRKVKVLVLGLVLASTIGFPQSTPQKIDLPTGGITLGAFIRSFERQTGLSVHWEPTVDTNLIIKSPGRTLFPAALNIVAREASLTWQKVGNTIFIQPKQIIPSSKAAQSAKPASHVFTLVVKDQNNDNLPGTTLALDHSTLKWQTDEKGMATIIIDQSQPIFHLTHVSMVPRTIIILRDGRTEIHVQTRYSQLDDVIVGGYTTPDTRRRILTSDRSTLTRLQMNNIPGSNVQTAVEGLAPGVLITETNGIRGSANYVTVHGQISIMNGTDPLYVIDNVPYSCGNQSLSNLPTGISGGSLGPFSLLALEDIERIDILKDADATAIYGSRGANGVFLLTTRQGTPGKVHVNFQASTGLSEITRTLPLMDTREYVAMRTNAFKNDTLKMNIANAPDIISWDTTLYTNWNKWLTGGLAPTANLQASLSGGSNQTNYIFSGNWLRETNVFPGNPSHDRLDGHFNGNHHSRNNKLDLGASAIIGMDWNNQYIAIDPAQFQFLAPDALPPAKLTDPNGRPAFYDDNVPFVNPLSFLRQTYQGISHNLLVNVIASYRLCPSLSLRSILGGNNVQTREFGATPITAQPDAPKTTGSGYFAHTTYSSRILEQQAEFRQHYGQITLSLLGGGTWECQNNATNSLIATGFTSDKALRYPALATSQIPESPLTTNYDYQALFSRLNGNWKDTYLLNLTARRDGSNRFGPREQFGSFWAAGAAWIFSNEAFFLHALSVVSYGKLRFSYGLTGNDQIGDHYLTAPSLTSPLPFQNLPGFYAPSQVIAGQTWESVKKMSASLDMGLIDDRILLTLTWYRNRAGHQLLPDGLPTSGPDILFKNVPAVLQNEGWDIEITAKMIDKKDLSWTSSFNCSFPVSRLLAYPGLGQSPFAESLVIGQPLMVVKGYRYLGVNSSTGIFQYALKSGEEKPTIADIKVIGRLGVTYFGGLNNIIHWKHFQFEFLLSGRKQTGSSYQASIYAINPPGTNLAGFYSNETKALNRPWEQPGDHSSYQKLTTDTSTTIGRAATFYPSSAGILDNASFIRLKKACFSYQLSMKSLARLHISAATVFINTQNLFTYTPYKDVDPEVQSAVILPLLRTVAVGFNLSL